MPGLYYRLQDVVFGDGVIATRATLGGTPNDNLGGVLTNGGRFEIFANDFHYVRPADCRIIRTFHSEDWVTALGQLGAWPPPGVTGR